MWLPLPSKRPTSAEYRVLLVSSSLFFFGVGVLGIVCGVVAAPENAELAHQAIGYGLASIGVGLIVALGFWVARKLTRE